MSCVLNNGHIIINKRRILLIHTVQMNANWTTLCQQERQKYADSFNFELFKHKTIKIGILFPLNHVFINETHGWMDGRGMFAKMTGSQSIAYKRVDDPKFASLNQLIN